MEGAMGLMRRMPPKHTQTALSALLSLLPDHSSDLLSQIDQPLQGWRGGLLAEGLVSITLRCLKSEDSTSILLGVNIGATNLKWPRQPPEKGGLALCGGGFKSFGGEVLCDEDSGKEFILCEYNRDADCYRSPWSNKFHPHLDDGMYPSEELRKLEVEANEVFTIYRDQYYEGGISSVYLWEEDDNEGFVACFLIKKDGSKYAHGKRGYLHEGGWEAIHVIQVGPDEEGMAHYCLTSTIMLSLTTDSDTSGTFNLSGSIRRQ
ncbi:probable F-actin-capping protein subunit beta, partial [Tanacetum coccineum]